MRLHALLIAATLLALALLLSCSDSTPTGAEDEDQAPTLPARVPITVTAALSDTLTRHWYMPDTGTMEYDDIAADSTHAWRFASLPATHTWMVDTTHRYCLWVTADFRIAGTAYNTVNWYWSLCDSGCSPGSQIGVEVAPEDRY